MTLEKTLGLKDISAIVLKACPQRGIRSDCELKFSRAKVEIVFKPVA